MQSSEPIQKLYQSWIQGWNDQNAKAMSDVLAADARVIGYDGSQMIGRDQIFKEISDIFARHPTGFFVTLVQEIRLLSPTVAMLRANIGMVPRDRSGLNPAVNAVQTLVATEADGKWLITVFQNTPAQLHGRPDLVSKMTEELRQEAIKSGLLNSRPSGPSH